MADPIQHNDRAEDRFSLAADLGNAELGVIASFSFL